MRFAVVGTGGVGGFFGGKLALAGEEVWFIARGAHLDALRSRGLQVFSTEGDFLIPPGRMTDTCAVIGPSDVVLVCVKSYDTESVAPLLAPLIGRETVIISLQNGIENEENLQRALPSATVYGGIAYIYSTITSPGVVTETGGPKRILFGRLDPGGGDLHDRGKAILEAMQRAGIRAAWSANIRAEIWKKFIFISAVGGLTALLRLPLGEILAVEESRSLLEGAMREAEAVARASGIGLEAHFVDSVFASLKKFKNNTYSSLYYDLMHEKPMEIEAFSGTLVRYGRQLGIATPVHRSLYAALLPHHLKHLARRKADNPLHQA